MRHLRRYFKPLARTQDHGFSVYVHRRRAVQDEEELARPCVVMPHFGLPRRYTLLNDTQSIVFDQVPAVTLLSPTHRRARGPW